ncbi:MAG: glycoside hydrolase family 38 C-terminal domain-containing protein [bacterium]
MRSLRDLYVVTHTHWDREWYRTEERFRQRLVRLIDEILDDPPIAGDSFLLDGQSILIDDYLAVRPERAAELSVLLRNGRIEAGPWYVLADELIPSGEALVRNLMVGRETVRRLRGEPPPVLYCPDSFGHPAIMPDLAAGFGCDVIILWRGFGGARSPAGDVVQWRGAAGNTVLLYHLPPDGYEFGSSLPSAQDEAERRWESIRDVLAPRAVTGTAILLNGADHHARQREHAAAIDALAAAAGDVHVHRSSLHKAARAAIDSARDTKLPAVAGELRDSYGYTWTLQGTLGARASQKRRNAMAERLLVRDVEPWLMLSGAAHDRASRSLLTHAWRALLQAHPHDTLCGTSVDAVADAFDARLASVEEQSRGLREEALLSLLSHDREHARMSASAWQPAILLRNAVARPRGGVVELTLRTTLADIAVGPGSASRQGERRRAAPWRVDGMPLQILSRHECVELTESPRAYPDADLVLESRALGWTNPIGGYVAETRMQRGAAGRDVSHPVVASARSLENERVRIDVSDDGVVSFTDLELDRRIANVITLERAHDVGDLYTPAIRELLAPPKVKRVRLVHRGPLRGEISIEYQIKGASGGTCRLAIQLDANARAMRIVVVGENRERDQRLRLRVATGLRSATTVVDAAFLSVERTAIEITSTDAMMEHVVPTAPLHRWIARFASNGGAALVSDGLAEVESNDDGSVAVTLVRAVGELSRADLPERPGHAGWPAPTPGAQCIGAYEALFALQLFAPDSSDVRDELDRFAEDVLLPITGETLRSNLLEAREAGGLELLGAGLTFSASLPAQREGWNVLRCVNQRDTIVSGEWRIAAGAVDACRARLDETPLDALPVEDGVVRFTANPREIVTILVRAPSSAPSP